MFGGHDLLRLPERAMRRVRGNEISMIFQEPMSSLNPLLTVGEQIAEVPAFMPEADHGSDSGERNEAG